MYLQYEIEDRELFEDFLSGKKGRKVYLKTPKKGENLKLINMIKLNARKELEGPLYKIAKKVVPIVMKY